MKVNIEGLNFDDVLSVLYQSALLPTKQPIYPESCRYVGHIVLSSGARFIPVEKSEMQLDLSEFCNLYGTLAAQRAAETLDSKRAVLSSHIAIPPTSPRSPRSRVEEIRGSRSDSTRTNVPVVPAFRKRSGSHIGLPRTPWIEISRRADVNLLRAVSESAIPELTGVDSDEYDRMNRSSPG